MKTYFSWLNEPAKCNCGGGHGKGFIYGTANGRPAKWKECRYCTGAAIGRPWVFVGKPAPKGHRCVCGNWLDGRNQGKCPNCGNRF